MSNNKDNNQKCSCTERLSVLEETVEKIIREIEILKKAIK